MVFEGERNLLTWGCGGGTGVGKTTIRVEERDIYDPPGTKPLLPFRLRPGPWDSRGPGRLRGEEEVQTGPNETEGSRRPKTGSPRTLVEPTLTPSPKGRPKWRGWTVLKMGRGSLRVLGRVLGDSRGRPKGVTPRVSYRPTRPL